MYIYIYIDTLNPQANHRPPAAASMSCWTQPVQMFTIKNLIQKMSKPQGPRLGI